ncbi:MAG: OadG family protein [Bacteroidales bacterium]|nr:OadG family protein [Bacteroidales bacterium]
MNKIYKLFTIGVLCVAMFAGGLSAKKPHKRPMPPKQGVERPMPPEDGKMPPECEMHHHGMPMHGQQPVTFQSNQICFIPEMQAYVVVDSTDCAIDLVERDEAGNMKLIGRHVTDSLYKRHDLKNIHRPKSVWVLGDKIIYLASSAKDSAHIGILSMEPEPAKEGEHADKLCYAFGKEKSYFGLHFNAYAFDINPMAKEITVVGTNALGYSIAVVDLTNFPEELSFKGEPYNYHKKKQSEVIADQDPYGLGLTVVAVSVVFIALISVCLIMLGYGSAIRSWNEKRKKKDEAKKQSGTGRTGDNGGQPAEAGSQQSVDGDVYAAIATAIYLYNEELHDDEDMVITIQNVERTWTPWNDKRFNMNQYFNKK